MPFTTTRDPAIMQEARKTFIERPEKPTYRELGEAFGIPLGTICSTASEESWTELRAAHLQREEVRGDALGLVLQAASRVDRRVMQAFADVVLLGLQKLSFAIEKIPEDQASSTQVQTVSTASFAFKNFADGCKAVGIISFGKELAALGKEDNGRWNPQMLSQINLTVQNLVSQAGGKPIDPTAAAPVVVPSGPEKPGPIAGKNSERDE